MGTEVPGPRNSSSSMPAVAITTARLPSTRRIAARSKGTQAAQLLDEGGEGHVEVERRAERAGGPARRLLHVDPPSELVAEPLRFGGTLAGRSGLAALHVDEAPDDRRRVRERSAHGA